MFYFIELLLYNQYYMTKYTQYKIFLEIIYIYIYFFVLKNIIRLYHKLLSLKYRKYNYYVYIYYLFINHDVTICVYIYYIIRIIISLSIIYYIYIYILYYLLETCLLVINITCTRV